MPRTNAALFSPLIAITFLLLAVLTPRNQPAAFLFSSRLLLPSPRPHPLSLLVDLFIYYYYFKCNPGAYLDESLAELTSCVYVCASICICKRGCVRELGAGRSFARKRGLQAERILYSGYFWGREELRKTDGREELGRPQLML